MAKALNARIGNQAYLMQEVREWATVFDDFFAKFKHRNGARYVYRRAGSTVMFIRPSSILPSSTSPSATFNVNVFRHFASCVSSLPVTLLLSTAAARN
jgi:hypothetical protein